MVVKKEEKEGRCEKCRSWRTRYVLKKKKKEGKKKVPAILRKYEEGVRKWKEEMVEGEGRAANDINSKVKS